MKVNLESRVGVTMNVKIGSSNQIIEKQSTSRGFKIMVISLLLYATLSGDM